MLGLCRRPFRFCFGALHLLFLQGILQPLPSLSVDKHGQEASLHHVAGAHTRLHAHLRGCSQSAACPLSLHAQAE
jgi:hypothetical protein